MLKKISKGRRIITIILWVVAALLIAFGILTRFIRFIVIGLCLYVISSYVVRKRKKDLIGMIVITLIYIWIMSFIQIACVENNGMSWIYPLQSAYIGTLRNVTKPEWFPDKFEEIKSDFQFSYCMAFQDPGHYSVAYKTTPEYIAKLKEIYEPMAAQARAELESRAGAVNYSKYNYDKNERFWGYSYNEADLLVYYIVYRSTDDDAFYNCGVLLIDENTCKVEFRDH